MLQDISPEKFYNQYKAQSPLPDDLAVVVKDGRVLLRERGDEVGFPSLRELGIRYDDAVYLFSVGSCRLYLTDAPEGEGLCFYDMAQLRTVRPKWVCFAGVTACQLARWYRSNRYCGRCGAEMLRDSTERMLVCSECKNTVYPKICPAVIVGVINGEKMLMTKYAAGKRDHYSLVAGFAEIGETIEETVCREVMEETGLKIKNMHYYKSQPWPYSDSLLFGFYCEADGNTDITVDTTELASAEWIERRDIFRPEYSVSLTYEMMEQFRLYGRCVLE